MPDEKLLLQCYNRGCGQKYDADTNKEDSCRHHPGQPVFHDAYKGWSCCNKKCTDFTEFLNIRGCTLSKHSNVKPPEPQKPVVKEVNLNDVIEVKPIIPKVLKRPPLDSPLIIMKPVIASSLKGQLNSEDIKQEEKKDTNINEITIGTTCKNSGCQLTYEGPHSNISECTYHSGVPIFHEGLKFWSCCQRKTTDFNTFLSQTGCVQGTHVWKKSETDSAHVSCRWDFHQTVSHVVVAIYAKQYCPIQSVVKLNPVRLYANLVFPQHSNACFTLDIELRGIINVEASQLEMFGTKVEIKLKKAEAGSWVKLGDPIVQPVNVVKDVPNVEKLAPRVEAVDLDDL